VRLAAGIAGTFDGGLGFASCWFGALDLKICFLLFCKTGYAKRFADAFLVRGIAAWCQADTCLVQLPQARIRKSVDVGPLVDGATAAGTSPS
jgi:hypothetical protein